MRIVPKGNRLLGLRPWVWLVIVNGLLLLCGMIDSRIVLYLGPIVVIAWFWSILWWMENVNGSLRQMHIDDSISKLQCPKCGYDLHHLSENRCPECGEEFHLGITDSQE